MPFFGLQLWLRVPVLLDTAVFAESLEDLASLGEMAFDVGWCFVECVWYVLPVFSSVMYPQACFRSSTAVRR
jgi:hypothetical protein